MDEKLGEDHIYQVFFCDTILKCIIFFPAGYFPCQDSHRDSFLVGRRRTGSCKGNNGKSVSEFVVGSSIQCCGHPHCSRSITSSIWFCHDTFTFRRVKPYYISHYHLKHSSFQRKAKSPKFIMGPTLNKYSCPGYHKQTHILQWCLYSYRWANGPELYICRQQLIASTVPWIRK